jgi:ribose transport system permease protein
MSEQPQQISTARSSRFQWGRLLASQELSIFVVLVLMIAFLHFARPGVFLTPNNLANVTRAFSWIAIAAFGQTIVIITGGIDLSAGAVMAISGMATALVISSELSPFVNAEGIVPSWAVPLGVMVGMSVGVVSGLINGLLVSRVNLPPFIATLGTMSIARGIAYGMSSGQSIRKLRPEFAILGREGIVLTPDIAIPYPTIIMFVLAIITAWFLAETFGGRHIYALGGNEEAAELSGIKTRRVKLLVYIISGLAASIGGILMTSRLGVAAPTAALGYELDVIAAVVIGGTSLMGGEGTILGTLIGAAIMQVLRTGLNILGFPAYWQSSAIGLTIILAVTVDRWRRNRNRQ